MPTQFIVDPFIPLAAIALGKLEHAVTPEERNEAQVRASLAVTFGAPFHERFLGYYPPKTQSGEQVDKTEKLLRLFWRGDLDYEVFPGGYQHFKGGLYTVEQIALLLEGSKEEVAVIYFGIQDPSKVFVRPLREWYHIVLWPDGEYRPRFMPTHP